MAYKHGVYGVIDESRVRDAVQASTVAAYIGTAPVNLIRGYAEKGLVNNPVLLTNKSNAQAIIGYSDDWSKFTLCEAIDEHFNNTVQNVGPIYIINVLDPDTHRAASKTTKSLTFVNGKAEFKDSSIILDTFAIADKVEGIDYEVSYSFAKGTVQVKMLTGSDTTISASYSTVDVSAVTSADIIGETTAAGEYKGLDALKLLYQKQNAVLNLLAAPGYSEIPDVYKAMVGIVQKLNGHWDGFVMADIPLHDGETAIDTIAKAKAWKEAHGYDSEFSKVFWPQVKDGSGKAYHLSTVGMATQLAVDILHDGVPFESCSNKEIMATAQYFGEDAVNNGFDELTANELNEAGITSATFRGGVFVLWGPHTAAYKYGSVNDPKGTFDVNIRMLEYVENSFQLDHMAQIDIPMTPGLKDSILNAEQNKLNALASIGALIGEPEVLFLETENSTTDMLHGDFVWNIAITNAPPFKSGTAKVAYTDEGFSSFFTNS